MLAAGQRTQTGVEETRARIINAARELFEARGTRGTTTREVAERAGVNEATLFRHFGSKRALLDAMREASCGIDELRSTIASLSGTDVCADLRVLARQSVEHMLAKRAMMCVSLAEEAAGTDDAPEWRGPSQIMDELVAYFTARIAAGQMRGDALVLARCFLGTFFSYVVGRKIWGSGAIADPAAIDAIVDVFLNGACV